MTPNDPVTLAIMWDRLISLVNEMASTLIRTSFSAIVRESLDLSVVLFDANGVAIAQSRMGAPGHSGTAGNTLRYVLRYHPKESMRPGDLFITNDPWHGTGHMFDMNFVRPVFRGAALVGFTFTDTHLPDIGGGGWSATGVDMYAEGLHLPPVRLMAAGSPNRELLNIIRTNVRISDQVVGDLMANVTANEVGGRLLVAFMEEYALEDLGPLAALITTKSELAMREKIREIPDGVYPHTTFVDGWERPIKLCVEVHVQQDHVLMDFTGTDPIVNTGINVPLCYTRAMSIHAVRLLTVPEIPANDGTTYPIALRVPENCILNALPPAATGGRHVVGHFPTSMIFAALASVLPERVQADCGMLNSINVHGRHRDGTPVGTMYFTSGGYGAMAGMDGISTIPSPANMRITPTEVWEHMTSLKVECRRLLPDSGGAGEFRGGLGQEIVLRNTSGHDFLLSFFGRQTDFPPAGMMGGKPGSALAYLVDGQPAPPTKRAALKPGSVLTILKPGGGGYGDPHKRPVEKVAADVRDGFVSLNAALKEYGVLVEPASGRASRV